MLIAIMLSVVAPTNQSHGELLIHLKGEREILSYHLLMVSMVSLDVPLECELFA